MKSDSTRITKSFAVFDCDAHVNDPVEIWTKYVEPEYRDLVKQAYWNDGTGAALLNGQLALFGGHFPAARVEKKMPTMTTSARAGSTVSLLVARALTKKSSGACSA